jgi:ribonuclease Z
MFGVTILGNNSAIPAFDRHPTAQIVTLNDNLILIDCGEGTQMQIAKYRIKTSKINHILISHLHGDHYFGLIGFLTSMSLLNREKPIHLFAPKALEKIIQMQLDVANTSLCYTLHFHGIEDEGVLFNGNNFLIETFKTKHRIECWGFKISEKKLPRKIDKEKALLFEIPVAYFDALQKGNDYINKEGKKILNHQVTISNTPNRSYVYSADTIYDEELISKIKEANLLYHEATYLMLDEEKAAKRFHSTSTQAASIAKLAKVKHLLLGHFSSKYEKLDEFLNEAKTIFEKTSLAIEGVTYQVL